ncbi:TPA: aromatic amino acid transport family protein, partial [Neisseria gonorrhoeae]
MSAKTPSLFGGAMIIAGTVIGAGMLANPTATSGVWFTGSLIVLLYTWFSMLSGGLMILEVNTHYPRGASFDT